MNTQNEDVQTTILAFLKRELPKHSKALERIGPDESLIDAGILDSIAMLSLVTFIEAKWKLSVPSDAFVPERFSSISRITALVGELQS
jgi:acyl carrier protein